METIHELKAEKENKISELIKSCGVFFAFSNEQFEQGKTPLAEGDKYVSMGMGGYMPKSQVSNWINGMKDVDKWYKKAVKDNKARKSLIAYELGNYECWYTGDIEPALNALGEGYTPEEVRRVFNEERVKQIC